jgi:hypothetical protein
MSFFNEIQTTVKVSFHRQVEIPKITTEDKRGLQNIV